MLSVVINTAAGGNPDTKSWTGQRHVGRAYALRNFIIPYYVAYPFVTELIVVGEWEPGPGYLYIESPSKHMNWNDALEQRQRGFLASQGEWVLFSHDDHLVEFDFLEDEQYDVLVPDRFTRMRSSTPERINNGSNDGYIMGHAAFYKRKVIEACPWTNVPPTHRTWDVMHTKQILDAGFHVHWDHNSRAYDVEFGAEPWK